MSEKSPILFIIFNRPDTTSQVFEAIRRYKPEKLYVAADGPRLEKVGELEKCNLVRSIIDKVDWDCDVKTLFRDKNLGCKHAVSSAISWFFENEEEGIILEDDCLPSASFFNFCENMLAKYRDDKNVMIVSGSNFQDGIKRSDASYYFSKCCHIWGWASWRRVWNQYDIEMKTFPQFVKSNQIQQIFNHPSVQWYWLKMLYRAYNGEINTWDYQFNYAVWSNNGINIIPNSNLVSNIGFGEDSTHTNFAASGCVKQLEEIDEILHPDSIKVCDVADKYTFEKHYGINLSLLKAYLRKLFGKDKLKWR